MAATASASMQVNVSVSGAAASDPAHTRTLTAELARALESVHTLAGYTLDVSLAPLRATASGRNISVHVETRAALSDANGYVQWVSIANATAQGSLKDRVTVERDAIAAVAAELARRLRARSK